MGKSGYDIDERGAQELQERFYHYCGHRGARPCAVRAVQDFSMRMIHVILAIFLNGGRYV
jgi:hypothetical protein